MAKKQLTSEEIFRTMTVPQAVRTMAVPAVMSQIIVLIYNLADTFFIGRTNNPYMVAGVSLILPLFNVCLAIGSMFGTGGGALLPKLLATDQREEGSRVAAYCIRLGLLTAFGFSILTLLFMYPLLTLLGAGPNTYAYARSYVLMVLVIGGIPTIVSNVFSNLLRSLSLAREAGIGVALGGILNIFLDPLFMFVLLPPGNEVLGVGIATLLSNLISHSATAALLMPILVVVCMAMGDKLTAIGGPTTVLIGVAIASSSAMILPISTPPNALAYATNLVQQKDMAKVGIIMGFTSIALGYLALIAARTLHIV